MLVFPRLRHYVAGCEDANETIVEFMLRAAPKSILVQDKEGRTPLDRAREAEVGIAAYNILRAYFKEQQKENTASVKGSRKVQKKKDKLGDLNDSMASLDLNDIPAEDALGVSANLDESTRKSKKKVKKKKKEGGLNMSTSSMDLNDVVGEDVGGSSAVFEDSARSTKKKKKKKHERDPNESSVSIALDEAGGYRSIQMSQASLDVLVTPRRKKKGATDKDRFDESMSAPASAKGKKKTRETSAARSPSRSRRRKPVENEEGVVGGEDGVEEEDLRPLETPKPRKIQADSVLKTPGSVSSKAIKTPTSSVVTRRRRLTKDLVSRSPSDRINEGVPSTEATGHMRHGSRSMSPKSAKSSGKSSTRTKSKSKRSSKSGGLLMEESTTSLAESPVLPDLMTPSSSALKKTKSALVSDFLATPQLSGGSMSFLPPVWGDGERAL
jgi:hypothetical protein